MKKIKLLLYCTKSKPYLTKTILKGGKYKLWDRPSQNDINGKIVAECEFEIEEIEPYQYQENYYSSIDIGYKTKTTCFEDLLKKSGLTHSLMDAYLFCDIGYAIHIKNLNVFDKPRELENYKTNKAPQNMMHCYGRNTGEKYILISIRPEYLVKILNKEKTIEVRRKVLKEMMQNA